MGRFGLRLRGEREKRDLRLVDVAKATGVAVHHLSAIEYDDFDALPDARQVEGYVRAYAKCLDLDPDATVGEFLRELAAGREVPAGDGENPVADEPSGISNAREPRFGRWLPVVAGVVLVVLILVLVQVWWIGAGSSSEEPAVRTEPGASAPERVSEAQEPSGASTALSIEPEPLEAAPVAIDPPPDPDPEPPRLTVPDHGVGTGVVSHRLVGQGERFAEGTRVWFWTRVLGGTAGETLLHVWIHEGRETTRIPLTLGGSHWRTQSRRTLSPGSSGRWAVEARDEAGRLLARREFVCVSPAPP